MNAVATETIPFLRAIGGNALPSLALDSLHGLAFGLRRRNEFTLCFIF
jgi:hypothetical protein